MLPVVHHTRSVGVDLNRIGIILPIRGLLCAALVTEGMSVATVKVSSAWRGYGSEEAPGTDGR